MNDIRIIADSTCDLDPSILQDMELLTLPLIISVGDRSYLDGEDIRVAEIYDFMRKGFLPKTSQIPYDRIYGLFKSLCENGSDFIYIAFSSEMSGCFSLASIIAGDLRAEYPERKIAVIDSKGGSSATGLIVLQALKMARRGLLFEVIEDEVIFMTEHIEHVFSVDDLEWLSKGGRIPRLVGYVGSKLGIRPLLDVEKGRIMVRKMVRGRNRAIQTVAEEIIRRAGSFPAQLIAINHADDLPAAKLLESLVKTGLPQCKTTLCHIGGVLSVHIGLKGIGAYCFNLAPKHYSMI